MQFSLQTILLASMATLAMATPVAEPLVPHLQVIDTRSGELQARGEATVEMYAGDTCNGQVDSFSVANKGERCVPVPSPKRSIKITSRDCTIRTHSGTDCRGSNFKAGNGCFGVLYGSVSVKC
ncbi:hypothetical protein QBC37DRAFT_422825 [Rhypophila decipiens]|uniref:Lectin n=1 Tax=Rhypophila decipiens TaxID=261697 RepID=A0AAN6YCI2_9PEZI|nr:hypothetical protein QBC37DRAFT_422825 [Rhypophila decipiens]